MLMAAATTGMVATSQAATIYTENSSPDLANTEGGANVLTSGNVADQVIGNLDSNTDRADHFILNNLPGGGTITLSYNYTDSDSELGVTFTFADPNSGVLETVVIPSINNSANGITSELTIPDSGQIRVSVVNDGSFEGGGPASNWEVSIQEMAAVPEPSGAALLALGSLLAMKRRRI